VSFLSDVIVFLTPFSLSLSSCLQLLLGDYYSTKKKKKTKKKIEYIERKKASNNESNDGKIGDGPLHVDVGVSMRVRESERVFSSIIRYILTRSKRFSLFYSLVEQK